MQDRNSGTNVTSGGVLEVGAIGRLGEHNYGSPEGWVLRRPAPPRPAPPRSAPPFFVLNHAYLESDVRDNVYVRLTGLQQLASSAAAGGSCSSRGGGARTTAAGVGGSCGGGQVGRDGLRGGRRCVCVGRKGVKVWARCGGCGWRRAVCTAGLGDWGGSWGPLPPCYA